MDLELYGEMLNSTENERLEGCLLAQAIASCGAFTQMCLCNTSKILYRRCPIAQVAKS